MIRNADPTPREHNEITILQCDACGREVDFDATAKNWPRALCDNAECIERRAAIFIKPQPKAVTLGAYDI